MHSNHTRGQLLELGMATEEEAAAGGEGAEEHAWHRDWKYITFDSSLRRVRRQNKSSIRKSDFNGYVVQLLRLPAFSVGRNSGYYVRASLSLFDATTSTLSAYPVLVFRCRAIRSRFPSLPPCR